MKKNDKLEIPDLTGREYFTPFELSRESWFPIKASSTIYLLIENGIIKAINVSAVKDKNRYKISKEEVIKYLVRLDETSK